MSEDKVKLQCIGKSEDGTPCKRRVTWNVERVGNQCNSCFEKFFDTHWRITPLDSIRRLSDNEKDFSDYKSYGYGPGRRKVRDSSVPLAAAVVAH